MEMPEGLARLQRVCIANTWKTEGRKNQTVSVCLDLIVDATSLLEEMWRVLEIEEMAYFEAKMKKNPVTPILKKFKEWT